jgi:hypothetical protein
MKNIFIADIIKFIHIILVLMVLTGFIFLPRKFLPYYIIFIILVLLDWNDKDGLCILTRIEHYFRTGKWEHYESQPEFIRPLVNKVFKTSLSESESTKLNYFVFLICLLLGFIRLQYIDHFEGVSTLLI